MVKVEISQEIIKAINEVMEEYGQSEVTKNQFISMFKNKVNDNFRKNDLKDIIDSILLPIE